MYDFNREVNRRNTDSLKWNVKESELPMWVADMDFETAPEIKAAITQKVEQGVFGYSIIPDAWYQAYGNWWKQQHQFRIEKDWLLFATGVIPIISSAVRKLTTPVKGSKNFSREMTHPKETEGLNTKRSFLGKREVPS